MRHVATSATPTTPATSVVDIRTRPVDAAVFDALPHGVAVIDATGAITATNAPWRASSHGPDPLAGLPIGTDLPAAWRAAASHHRAVAEHAADGLTRVLAGRAPAFEVQYDVADGDATRWFVMTARPVGDGAAVVTHTETTVHQSVREVLTDLAFHDGLTGLPNRALVVDRLQMALVRAGRTGTVQAVVFADLDGFKAVNDERGHRCGDMVLVEAARRLCGTIRSGDTCGRWGGDEFVLLVDLADPEAVDQVVARALEAFSHPFLVDGHVCAVGLSVGVALARADESAEDVIARADAAMYRAKRAKAAGGRAGR